MTTVRYALNSLLDTSSEAETDWRMRRACQAMKKSVKRTASAVTPSGHAKTLLGSLRQDKATTATKAIPSRIIGKFFLFMTMELYSQRRSSATRTWGQGVLEQLSRCERGADPSRRLPHYPMRPSPVPKREGPGAP